MAHDFARIDARFLKHLQKTVQTQNSAKSAEKCKNRASYILLIYSILCTEKNSSARLHDFFSHFLISHFLKEKI
jgi:hypothetical protein